MIIVLHRERDMKGRPCRTTRIITGVEFTTVRNFGTDEEPEICFGWQRDNGKLGQAVLLDRWEEIYVLHSELINSRPLSNLEWVKGGPNFVRHREAL